MYMYYRKTANPQAQCLGAKSTTFHDDERMYGFMSYRHMVVDKQLSIFRIFQVFVSSIATMDSENAHLGHFSVSYTFAPHESFLECVSFKKKIGDRMNKISPPNWTPDKVRRHLLTGYRNIPSLSQMRHRCQTTLGRSETHRDLQLRQATTRCSITCM